MTLTIQERKNRFKWAICIAVMALAALLLGVFSGKMIKNISQSNETLKFDSFIGEWVSLNESKTGRRTILEISNDGTFQYAAPSSDVPGDDERHWPQIGSTKVEGNVITLSLSFDVGGVDRLASERVYRLVRDPDTDELLLVRQAANWRTENRKSRIEAGHHSDVLHRKPFRERLSFPSQQ